MRDDPAPLWKLLHFHRERHCGVEGAHALILQPTHDASGDVVDLMTLAVEFEIGDRARGRADRFAVHPPNDGKQGSRGGKGSRDMCPLGGQRLIVDGHKAAIIGAAFTSERQEVTCGESLRGRFA
ncbi:MAG TPA: hypothetical protein VEK14_06385 [Rhodomicrobium sp.]|nr:hypothetical protein [Rhodomicrobium sp.]